MSNLKANPRRYIRCHDTPICNWLSRRSSAGAVRTYSQSVLNDPAICNAHFFNPNVIYLGRTDQISGNRHGCANGSYELPSAQCHGKGFMEKLAVWCKSQKGIVKLSVQQVKG
ncbi:hypothetical protein EV702DRAFT_1049077 [Suillus placidus]|uniref:Uncharacterized protein n=1 Tax=Suillus placidus TaxID=48579 RepID=A0A9P7CYF9_9AGAM|nr:hypothetical protein EV702DRAFT_1049077 [Suillus placidus]